MEHVNSSDDWSPPPTADSTASFIFIRGDSFLLTPNRKEYVEGRTLNLRYTNQSRFSTRFRQSLVPKLPSLGFDLRSKSFRGFEKPNFTRIAILIVLCVFAYAALYLLTLVARDKSLFTVRLIVSMWCSGVGFALGYTLLCVAIQHLEAVTWATIIHMSHRGTGMKLRYLAQNSDNPSFLSALRIFLCRFTSRETARALRGSYDKRPWSLFIGIFTVLAILTAMLPFLFGRVMDIDTFVRNQREVYNEVLIAGDLLQADVEKANDVSQAFKNFRQTWTLLPYGTSPSDYAELPYGNETVYFSQPSLSQFIPGGSGLGIFDPNDSASPKDSPNHTLALLVNGKAPKQGMGTLLRYSQWGIRIHCKKLPDPNVNLIPFSNRTLTYVFLPQHLLRGLFAGYGMDLPASLTQPDLTAIDPDDTFPSNIDSSKISYAVKFYDNDIGHSFHTRTIPDTGAISDKVWTTVETVLIRLNTTLTPLGRFPVYYTKESTPVVTKIGYDAAVCVEMYEPWIVEAYNTSIGSPAILRIVEKGYGFTSLPSGKIRGDPIPNTRYLNTTGKYTPFAVAHDNGVNQMVKDNGRDFSYVPAPINVAFTDGAGPQGYTELSSDRFATVRARADAVNVLPYLVGSGPIVAQSYLDQTLAEVTYKRWQLIGLLALTMVLGIIGELFVPSLPLNIAQRRFGVYSWLALFQSQALRFEVTHDVDKMSHDELEKRFGDMEVKLFV